MRAVVQRTAGAEVRVDGKLIGSIQHGLVVLLGITHDDGPAEVEYLSRKILGLRIFRDAEGRMNRSIVDDGGAVLLVSQFTLYGDIRKGRRPGFDKAAKPEQAERLYQLLSERLRAELAVETGVFGAYMQVSLVNDGPVTFIIDSAER